MVHERHGMFYCGAVVASVLVQIIAVVRAERSWSEGRGNPLGWTVHTSLGAFGSSDRLTWRTADGVFTAELRRSRSGQHVYLALFDVGSYLGRFDASGWRAASNRSRVRQLRPTQLPFHLAA